MIHGGDIYRNKVNIDFSVNVNPLGTPASVINSIKSASGRLHSYPDAESETLRSAIAMVFGISPDSIICGSGASELLMSICHGLMPKKVLIPIPSFFGYEWAAGCISEADIKYIKQDDIISAIEADTDMIFIGNPNNPTGEYYDKAFLEKLLKRAKECDCTVVLDECFMELSDDPASNRMVNATVNWDNLIIVRAFTKSFALPAIRLGYLVCANSEYIKRIRRQLPEWNVSLIAQEAGMAALREIDSLKDARKYIRKEREYLAKELNAIGIKTYPSVTNYLLLRSELNLYELLLERGILIRSCSNYRGLSDHYYRIAVKSSEDNELLIEELSVIV